MMEVAAEENVHSEVQSTSNQMPPDFPPTLTKQTIQPMPQVEQVHYNLQTFLTTSWRTTESRWENSWRRINKTLKNSQITLLAKNAKHYIDNTHTECSDLRNSSNLSNYQSEITSILDTYEVNDGIQILLDIGADNQSEQDTLPATGDDDNNVDNETKDPSW